MGIEPLLSLLTFVGWVTVLPAHQSGPNGAAATTLTSLTTN
jgi:hypothetical protein